MAGNEAVDSDEKLPQVLHKLLGMILIYKMVNLNNLRYEQGGKRWYDTDKVINYIWNDEIEAWVDYNLAGPQGPKGADGHHIVLISLSTS